MCNVWTKECSWVQCASNEEKIKQREDKVFVVISEKFRLYFGRFIFEPFSSHSTGTDSHYQYQVPVPVPGTTS